jgi:hypothetical protein
MSRVTKTLTPVRGRRYRITRLDACGNPVYGDDGQVVTSGVITATFTASTSATDEIKVVNSGGETCVLEPAITSLEGYTAEFALCGMDPDMFEIMTGMPVIYDIDGAAVGVAIDIGVSLEDFSFGVEIWTGLASDDACGEVGTVEYGYILTPYMKGGHLGDFTVENNAINFTISDAASRKGGSWGKGPYNVVVNAGDVAGPLLSALTSTQVLLMQRTKVAPPAAAEGGRPLLDPAAVAIITVTATPDDLDVDFDISPTISTGVYYDFGDDTWDYVTTSGGDTSHTYAAAGTYTYTASSNGTVVSHTVTVTEGS